MYLDAVLADEPLTGGLEPTLGQSHLRVLTLSVSDRDDPRDVSTEAQSARLCLSLSTRRDHARQDRCHEVADKNPPAGGSPSEIHCRAILKEVMTNEASSLLDNRCQQQGPGCRRGLAGARIDAIGQTFVTATLTVWDDDPPIRR